MTLPGDYPNGHKGKGRLGDYPTLIQIKKLKKNFKKNFLKKLLTNLSISDILSFVVTDKHKCAGVVQW